MDERVRKHKAELGKWLNFVERDLKFAKVALRERFLSHCCLLSHQCVEKALKGYLVFKDKITDG